MSFALLLITHVHVLYVNENSKKTSLEVEMDQIGHGIMRLIHAFVEAPECANIFQAKCDIKDGFWRLDFKEGEEWNLLYNLPQKPGMPIMMVVTTSLKMGWI